MKNGKEMKQMSNKLKDEMNKIEIPKEIHERSRVGIQKAKLDIRKSRRNWFLIATPAVACLLVLMLFIPNFFLNKNPGFINKDGEAILADDLHFEGKYYLNIWELTIIDNTKIKKIGEVEKANRLTRGSDIYEIEGYSNRNFIAVKDKDSITGYSIYSEYSGDGKPIPYPEGISHSMVTQIRIYKQKELVNAIQGEDAQRFIALFEQEGPHNEFIVDTSPQYNVVFLTYSPLGYKYPISEKDGEFGLPMFESRLPKEIADYFNTN